MSRKKIYEKVNCIGIVCIFIVVALELSGKNIRERKAWICVLCDAFFVSGMILLGIGLRKFSNRTYSTILRRKKIIRIKNNTHNPERAQQKKRSASKADLPVIDLLIN